ncbi:hypothetical protein [Streptomyces sp. NPDC057545]|uniref:hypothetical protein n=1 Tax=Streptomyces sp. NPDC057545 TaxID=3346164 RepID=UPI003691BFCF
MDNNLRIDLIQFQEPVGERTNGVVHRPGSRRRGCRCPLGHVLVRGPDAACDRQVARGGRVPDGAEHVRCPAEAVGGSNACAERPASVAAQAGRIAPAM